MWDAITSRIVKLTEGEPDPLKNELKQAYRGMLAKNLRATRCKDNEIPKGELPDYVQNANKLLGDNPLTIEDIAPTELASTPKLTHILQKSSLTRKLKEEMMAIRDTKIVDNKIVKRDPNDIEWAAKVNEFVDRALLAEGSDGETGQELLFIKAAMLGAVCSPESNPATSEKASSDAISACSPTRVSREPALSNGTNGSKTPGGGLPTRSKKSRGSFQS